MQTLGQTNEQVTDPRAAGPVRIYWLAFLLTGQREPSLDLAIEVLDSPGGEQSFFSTWMLSWSRKVVIAKALNLIRDELAASARRTASASGGNQAPANWSLDPNTNKYQLERALLAIDVFPRCALVLSVFEGAPLADVAILLGVDEDLARRGQAAGLLELTNNLAGMQGKTSGSDYSYVLTSEMQHA